MLWVLTARALNWKGDVNFEKLLSLLNTKILKFNLFRGMAGTQERRRGFWAALDFLDGRA